MTAAIERAKLIPMNGNNADMNKAINVQFNPTTLKVSLSNTLRENSRNSSSQAAQYVDKSTSSLTVELIFDTTYIEPPSSNQNGAPNQGAGSGASSNSATSPGGGSGGGASQQNQISEGSDVRLQTKKIAEAFIKPVGSGNNMRAPKRCQFRWGAFEFTGLVESFEETLDFFSPEGRPLRATVSLKLSEDRYQFNTRSTADAQRNTPTLSPTGAGQGASGANNNQNVSPVPGDSSGKSDSGSWRDNAMFNGIETPRLPSAPSLSLPSVSLGASLGVSASVGVGAGISGGFGISGGVSLGGGISASLNLNASINGVSVTSSSNASPKTGTPAPKTSPAFKYGNSGSLGTGIEGAFSASPKAATSLNASSLKTGALQLRNPVGTNTAGLAGGKASTGAASKTASTAAQTNVSTSDSNGGRVRASVSVAGLLKNTDNGVGFD